MRDTVKFRVHIAACKFALLPAVAIQLGLFPLWILLKISRLHVGSIALFWVDFPLVAMFITGIAVPIYLGAIGFWLTKTATINKTISIRLFLVFCFLVNLILDYLDWGITSGEVWYPDGETLAIEIGLGAVGIILMILSFVVTFAIRKIGQSGLKDKTA